MNDGAARHGESRSRRRGKHFRPRPVPLVLPLALIVVGLVVACAPLFMDLASRGAAHDEVSRAEGAWSVADDAEAKRSWKQARAYNKVLAGKSPGDVKELLPYGEQLAYGSWPCMCYLRIESVGIELPVYHGTSEESLSSGAGHIEGTSLPVGGKSSNCCISAHSGVASGSMFDGLRDVSEGDSVTVRTLGRTLAYGVVDVRIVDADDASALRIEKGRDLLTLVTCTSDPTPGMPRGGYGVNDRRLVVVCERRSLPAEGETVAREDAFAPSLVGRAWPAAVALAALAVLLAASAARARMKNATAAGPGGGGRRTRK